MIWYAVDNGPVTSYLIPGTTNPNGTAHYSAVIAGPNNEWSVTYSIVSDFQSDPTASINGLITTKNGTSTSKVFHCGIEVPICPGLRGGSLVGGTGKVTLIADGPGAITCAGGPVVQMITDGAGAATVFHCPFQLAASGSGIVSTFAVFGLPGPSQSGPHTAETVGASQRFKLTSLDTAEIQLTFLLKDAEGPALQTRASACSADLNGDGQVNMTDLQIFFQAWGQISFCPTSLPADLNNDGVVNYADMNILLAAWGACP